jgi:hypothetical protein
MRTVVLLILISTKEVSLSIASALLTNHWNCQFYILTHDNGTEHIHQACPKYSALREVIWPEETALQTKLYGLSSELERTA